MKPLIVSTGDALSCTQAMSYFARSASSPVRYHWMSARRALAIGSVANGIAASRWLTMPADLRAVAAVDLVDLLDELAVALHQPRVQAVLLDEAFQIGHRDAGVEVVGAGLQDVLSRPGRLVGHDRIDGRIEEHRLEPRERRVERLAGCAGQSSRRWWLPPSRRRRTPAACTSGRTSARSGCCRARC